MAKPNLAAMLQKIRKKTAVDDGWNTASELSLDLDMSLKATYALLKEGIKEGLVLVSRRPRLNISGVMHPVPVYKAK